jgi:hypothetical protein
MIKLDSNPTSLTYPSNSQNDWKSAHRLIVLVPANMDFSAAAARIWKLATTKNMQIQLLGLCKDITEEARLRRELITLASLLENGKLCVETKVEVGMNWVEIVKASYTTGDAIVCFAGQQAGLSRQPLNQIIEANLDATVYILSNPNSSRSTSNRLSQAGRWLGFLAIIASFGLLQTQMIQYPQGPLQNILLILLLIPEFWLLRVWDEQFK